MLFNPYYLLFLPVTSGLSRIPGLRASVNRKINGGFPPFVRERTPAGAPGEQLAETQNPRKVVFFWGVWEFDA